MPISLRKLILLLILVLVLILRGRLLLPAAFRAVRACLRQSRSAITGGRSLRPQQQASILYGVIDELWTPGAVTVANLLKKLQGLANQDERSS